MSRRLRFLLGAVVALALVDGALAALDRRDEKAHEATPGDRLHDFDPAGVAKVVLARGSGRPLVLSRSQGGQWVVASAKNFPARGPKVEQILARIRGWKRERVAGDARNHEQFAVTREKAISVRLEDYSGRVLGDILIGALTGIDPEDARLRGGNIDTSKFGRYMRLADDDNVYVVTDFLTGELEPVPEGWLASPLLAGEESRAKALVVRRRNGEQLTVLLDAPYPRLATGDQRPVDGERVRAVLHELLTAGATDVAEGDDASLGLQSPLVAAEVVFADGTPPAKLFLGDPLPASGHNNPSFPARVPEKPGPLLVSQVSVALVASATAESVALAHVLGEKNAGSIARASLRDQRGTVTLERGRDGKWTASVAPVGTGAPITKPLDDGKRLRALDAAAQLPVAAFDRMGMSAHGLAAPDATLTIELQNHERLEASLGSAEGPYVWARRSDLPCALAVPAESVVELKLAFEATAE